MPSVFDPADDALAAVAAQRSRIDSYAATASLPDIGSWWARTARLIRSWRPAMQLGLGQGRVSGLRALRRVWSPTLG
jgi:hypothetical protein